MTTRARTRRGPRRPTTRPASRAAAFTPDALSVGARHLEVGNEWVSSFAVTGFPREVHPGWLAPLLTYPGRLDVALHVEPIDPVTAAYRLKKQLAKLESGVGTPPNTAACMTRRSRPRPKTPTTCPPGSRGAKGTVPRRPVPDYSRPDRTGAG